MRLPSTSAQTSAETPGTDVHHRAAGEIQHRNLPAERPVEQPALAPDHVAQREINDRHPQHREQQRRR